MTEVLFYHLTQTPLERTLPDLLVRTLQRGWRAVVRAATPAHLPRLDDLLWSYDPASFLPHDVAGQAPLPDTPVYLTSGPELPNNPNILFLVERARVAVEEAPQFERLCLLFNGHEPDALDAARADWMAVKEAKLSGKYWAQDDGRWVEKAST